MNNFDTLAFSFFVLCLSSFSFNLFRKKINHGNATRWPGGQSCGLIKHELSTSCKTSGTTFQQCDGALSCAKIQFTFTSHPLTKNGLIVPFYVFECFVCTLSVNSFSSWKTNFSIIFGLPSKRSARFLTSFFFGLFFSLSIYTSKVAKQKHIQQLPDDIYLVLSGEIKMLKYITKINK